MVTGGRGEDRSLALVGTIREIELADKEGYFTNTWAVEIDPAEEHVVAAIAKRHGFSVIGKVS